MQVITLELLFDEIVELRQFIKEMLTGDNKSRVINHPICSESLNELGAALSKAQSEMAVAGENYQNSYLKTNYADLTDVVKASRPALSKNGLAVMQILNESSEGFVLITRLQHISGQYIESRVRIVPTTTQNAKNDIHSLASQLTYMKRYSYASLVGVVSVGEDDDAETAVAESRQLFAKGAALNQKHESKSLPCQTLNATQIKELERELKDWPDIAEMILDRYKLRSLADLPDERYFPVLDRIREIKEIRKGNKEKIT